LRTLWPLDLEAVLRSVRKTGRLAVVQEAPRTCGFAAEIAALVQERAFASLQAPIARITGWDTPFPYTLENDYLPLAPRIVRKLRELQAYEVCAMAQFEFKLPDIGEGVVEGEIVKWLVRAGDEIAEDQPLVEVMTDKATVTIPSPRKGKVLQTLGNEGDTAKVHQTLVVLEVDGGTA